MKGCGWCNGSLAGLRRDAKWCSKPCRQAAHRAGVAVAAPQRPLAIAERPMRFGYADPPYPKRSHLYIGHPDYNGEVDQHALVDRLVNDYPDGWALSTSAEALPQVLEYCPRTVRVAAWFRGERAVTSHTPLSSWEPVIYVGGRSYLTTATERRTDALIHGVTPRSTDPERVIGAKPFQFAAWMFDLLGMLAGDTLDDLYPGSGGITRAWELRNHQTHDTNTGDPHDTSDVATHDGTRWGPSDT